MDRPWAVYTDLSGVVNIGHGGFATEVEAVDDLIRRLRVERAEIAYKLAYVRRLRRKLRRS